MSERKPLGTPRADGKIILNDEEKYELIHRQHVKIGDLKSELIDTQKRLARVEDELRLANLRLNAEERMRPSLEILQRMANGVDPINRDRMQCAMAALPHETPRLTETTTRNLSVVHYNDQNGLAGRLERARERMRLIEANPEADVNPLDPPADSINHVSEPEPAA